MQATRVFSSTDAGQLLSVGGHLWDLRVQYPVMALYGEMGAGKTTLVKAVASAAGVREGAGSPTFSLVNEYRAADGSPIYHFDFYRIKSPDEAYDIGYEEYFYSGALCLVEWPQHIEELLPAHRLVVNISVNADDSRHISLQGMG